MMSKRSCQFLLPAIADERVDELLRLVRKTGMSRVSRSDLVGALIWKSGLSGDALSSTIREYQVAVDSTPGRKARKLPPGPRARV
jgi:hypothetical protein